jgi:hypothetical protein
MTAPRLVQHCEPSQTRKTHKNRGNKSRKELGPVTNSVAKSQLSAASMMLLQQAYSTADAPG